MVSWKLNFCLEDKSRFEEYRPEPHNYNFEKIFWEFLWIENIVGTYGKFASRDISLDRTAAGSDISLDLLYWDYIIRLLQAKVIEELLWSNNRETSAEQWSCEVWAE